MLSNSHVQRFRNIYILNLSFDYFSFHFVAIYDQIQFNADVFAPGDIKISRQPPYGAQLLQI